MTKMQTNWTDSANLLFCLAPMEGVTDTVFRQLLVEIGKPPIMFTEFTGVEQLHSPGFTSIMQNFEYEDRERPLVAQIWGTIPELFYNTAQMVLELGFDGVDINMGCPQRAITKKGACSALIKDKSLASEIVLATKEGVKSMIPVSVKTRIGFSTIETESWIGHLLDLRLEALTIHGRTAAEMSAVPTHWDEVQKAVEIRNAMELPTKIIGNGDINSLDEGLEKIETIGLDGVMIGRGIFKNPWLFANRDVEEVTKKEKLETMERHIELWEEIWGEEKYFERLKRFFKIYITGFPKAPELRDEIMQVKSLEEAKAIILREKQNNN